MIPIGEELKRRGCQVFWAIPESTSFGTFLRTLDFELLPVPNFNFSDHPIPLSQTYGENLLKNGYRKTELLINRLKFWVNHIDQLKPNLVVAEHAPSALLAAKARGIPVVATGTGFSIPPLESPMPSLQPWFSLPKKNLHQKERYFLETVNPALLDVGFSQLTAVSDIFKDVELFLATFPEFDHYEKRTNMQYHGPVVHSTQDNEPRWPSNKGGNVFIYLKPDNRFFIPILKQIKEMGLPVLAYVPGLPESERISLSGKNLQISPFPVNLKDAKSRCCFAITEGGHNTGVLLILQGVPLLVCPGQLEQAIWAYRISNRKLGVMIGYFDSAPDFKKKIEEIYTSSNIREGTQMLAKKYSNFDSQECIQEISSKCFDLSNDSRKEN
ncbi:MAG: hypothetical protein HQM08_18315 [Candidatus Riflebacteria bacterium]|nr:hypothetical protein [Candidatus Riflebacteria bacterium]